ncbi:MAG: type II toxin-antitoxin system VapC family toxin [Candidatus Woesearchaeota archaeon]
MYILDSDFIINYFRNKKRNVEIINKLVGNPLNRIFTTSINIYELIKGAYNSNDFNKEFNLVQNLKRILYIIDFDEDSSFIAAELFSDLKSKGSMISEFDILVASICLKNNSVLLTDNEKHFNKINGLRVNQLI